MSKVKTSYSCNSCNYKTIKWMGCCPECQEWNSFVEKVITQAPIAGKVASVAGGKATMMTPLRATPGKQKERMFSGIAEWDRVIGGGLMPHSFIILTGDPGIGKSTLLLQISNRLAERHTVFYFSTEESLQQVHQRALRLGAINEKLLFSDQADLQTIVATAQAEKPDIVIIDSIQNCYTNNAQSFPGSVGQLRESAFHLMRLAKEAGITVIVSGHITKEGNIAGPKTLEHMVDAVFYLQGEERWQTRVLRSVKNRFGTINELGFFQMGEHGLEQVPNINEHLMSEASYAPGSAITSVLEGSRPLLLELQALTIESKIGIPQRVVSGVDHKQVALIAAILEKYLQVRLSAHDIFFKISGGFKVKESAADLGIALALLSSYFQQPLPEKTMVLGEISLTGQIKPINQVNTFIREAEKFGVKQLLVARNQKLEKTECKVLFVTNVYELLSLFSA